MGSVTNSKNNNHDIFFNRELSWLGFNRRVLEQAWSSEYPLLERLRFLSFVSSNLDEFYEIRVAGLMQQVDSGIMDTGPNELDPKEQLRQIREHTNALVKDQYSCWRESLVPALKKESVTFKNKSTLTAKEKKWIEAYFEKEIFPVLTPLAIDHAHPFPQLTNKALYILVWIDVPDASENEHKIAVIPVPRILPRLIAIQSNGASPQPYIFLSDVLKDFAQSLFPGHKLKGAWEFRITRNSDLYINEEEIENLLYKIEEELYNMRRGAAVRLEIHKSVPSTLLNELLKSINLAKEDVFLINGPLNLLRLLSIYNITDHPKLKFSKFHAYTPPELSKETSLFESIAQEDFLLHHPYDSFTPVVDFLHEAAKDPQVFAIKQTVYRTSGDSPIIEALKEASRNGKQVTALIELKARFDEAANIEWARQLEEDGVHVVYGMPKLKTHCKCCLIVRREDKHGLRRYVHLSSGNYNPKTAKTYTDFSLLTADLDITNEVANLFNTLTGFASSPEFKNLLVAPFNLHTKIQSLILQETQNAKKGKPAYIFAKLNNLVDEKTIHKLYAASQAGVRIDLVIRGICCLIPGVKDLSETIRIRSILGRFLEHSRIFYFENHGHQADIYIGSADWMPRNFFRRIETVFPIRQENLRKRLTKEIIPAFLKDTRLTKVLKSDGTYVDIPKEKRAKPFSCQKYFMELADTLQKKAQEELVKKD